MLKLIKSKLCQNCNHRGIDVAALKIQEFEILGLYQTLTVTIMDHSLYFLFKWWWLKT